MYCVQLAQFQSRLLIKGTLMNTVRKIKEKQTNFRKIPLRKLTIQHRSQSVSGLPLSVCETFSFLNLLSYSMEQSPS